MNKLKTLFIAVVSAAAFLPANAQTSVNTLQGASSDVYSSPKFIDDISFTPEGILQTTESGGSKSIKVDECAGCC